MLSSHLARHADRDVAVLALVDDLQLEVVLLRVERLARLSQTNVRDGLSATGVL